MIDYDKLLAEHGDSPRALDWSPEGQRERFRVLYEVGIAHGSSVLDVGCGLGHFYDYLDSEIRRDALTRWQAGQSPGRIDYAGVDRSAPMIDRCRTVYPGVSFRVLDALTDPLPPADYVVASGVLNVETGTNESDARRLIHNCYEAARVAVAINFLSTRSPTRREGRHYFDPAAMLSVLDLCPRVTLRHDYRVNDFTLYLYKP